MIADALFELARAHAVDDLDLFQPCEHRPVDEGVYLLHRLGDRFAEQVDLRLHGGDRLDLAHDLHALLQLSGRGHGEQLFRLDGEAHTADQNFRLFLLQIDREHLAARVHGADEHRIPRVQGGDIDRPRRGLRLFFFFRFKGGICEAVFEGAGADEVGFGDLALFGDLFDARQQLFGAAGALVDDAAAFYLGGEEQLFALFLQCVAQGIDFGELSAPFRLQGVGALFFFFRLDAALLGGAEDVFKLPPALGEVGNGVLQDLFRKPQPAADGDGVAAARHADADAVQRLQGGAVELHAGVFDAALRVGKFFERRIVGGDDAAAAAGEQKGDDRPRDGLAFVGIGAAAQFVDEHEAVRARPLRDADDVFDVGREGGEVLFDGLRVADVAEHVLKHGDLGAFRRGKEDAARRHQAKEAAHLQRDRLAARVRAGDEQHAVISAQRQRHGHRRLCIQQRMPALADIDDALGVEARADALVFIGIFRLGVGAVEIGKAGDVAAQLPRHIADAARELQQDALDLFLFGGGELAQFVVHLQHLFRLDEEGGAAGGTVVHEAADARFVLGAHGQDVAVVSHGDDAVLQIFGAFAPHQLRKFGADALVEGADGAADVVELVAGVVADLVGREDLFGDVVFQRLVEIDARHDLAQQRRLFGRQHLHRAVRHPRRAQQAADGEQLSAGERRPLLGALRLVGKGRERLYPARAV